MPLPALDNRPRLASASAVPALTSLLTLTLTSALLILSGCVAPATINIPVRHPPKLNTSGIKRIAVMPFEYSCGDCGEAARHVSAVVADRIRALECFTLVDHAEIDRLLADNKSVESHADALLKGQVTRLDSRKDSKIESYQNKDGSNAYYNIYTTSVEIDFSYSLTRVRDGSLIGPVSNTVRGSDSSKDGYPSAAEVIVRVLSEHLKQIDQDLAPYTAAESRTFAAESLPDNTLKAEMRDAVALVKAGNYKPALESYLRIFDQYNSVAAAENAAILYESFGDIEAAAALMQRATDLTGNPRARDVLARLNNILRDQATLADGYGGKSSPAAKIAAFASAEIQKALPPKAIAWIYNNSPDNAVAEAIVDDISADFIKKGIGLVARDRHSAALIETEHILQMSGSVNDKDIVRIGNAAGANTIVFIGITGTGAMRRLQVRVLDVEKRAPIMQSDSGEKWQL